MASYNISENQVLNAAGITPELNEDELKFITTMNNLANQIESRRKMFGLTNKELARRAGISTSVLARIESGADNISIKTLCRVLTVLKADVEIKEAKRNV